MLTPKRYIITSALPYANGYKHIGHLAGAYLPADIYVRYLRAQQRDVVFVCGSDEHGTAIPIQAAKEGTTAQAIIDKYHYITQQNFEDLSISFDIYHRTSSTLHHRTAQEFFETLQKDNALQQIETEQFFDEQSQTFLADRYIQGTCPNCAFESAYGDQCEKCGKSLSPDELIHPKSTLSGASPIKKKTTHWYLPLNEHEDFLRFWILHENGNNWKTNVLGQCKSWIDGGLQPRAVTRDLNWGVQVPPSALAQQQDINSDIKKVLYVWFDAPIGYISATKQWALDNGKDWEPYWKDKDTKLVHFIGKDNIVFHCIIFPIMLRLKGYILPDQVPANEFMNLEGDKMSTSRNWKIDMQEYINDFVNTENGGKQCVDMLRYYLTAIAPETKDSEFTWQGFQDAVNSELVAVFANFINRTMVLMHKLCSGKVPPLHKDLLDDTDKKLITDIEKSAYEIRILLEEYKFRDAQFLLLDLARKGNKYMQEKEPWIVAKQLAEDPSAQKQIDNCLHLCLQLTANLAILANPFLPNTAEKICHQLKVVPKMLQWQNAGKINLLSVGYLLRAPELLFRKIEDAEVQAQVEKLKRNAAKPIAKVIDTPQADPPKNTIDFSDFSKIDLKIGTITSAEKVEKADKLLKLTVDLGTEQRCIVSGIAMHYQPEDIVGKQVTVVTNLAPRKMRGIESQGMILMAEDNNGKLHFVHAENKIDSGSKVS
jgi:methionyl-tRNA synthetase